MARRCIFCDGGPVTNEHAVAQWISSVLVPEKIPIRIETVNTWDGEIKRSERPTNSISDFQAKRVCGPCNHGWMSELESRAQPLLTDMFCGVPTTLTPSERVLLATWAAKTAIVFQYLGKPGREPSLLHRRWIAANVSPPPGIMVSLGIYSGRTLVNCLMTEQSLSGEPGELRDRDNPAIQWVTFHLGQLVIQVLFIATSEKVLITIPREYEPYLIPIWPPVSMDVVWPPPNILDDNGFESLVRIALA